MKPTAKERATKLYQSIKANRKATATQTKQDTHPLKPTNHPKGYELNEDTRIVKVYGNFRDKQTGEARTMTNTYKISEGVSLDLIMQRLDQQNADFLRKNIETFLIPSDIVKDISQSKLIKLMAEQVQQ